MAENLGHVTAYAYAKSQGYTGTEEEFAIEIAHSASNAQIARLNALKAEGFAVGTQDGDPSETYEENNAEYFKNLAAGSAGSAASSASVASQKADSASADALKAEGYALGTQNGASVPSGSPYYEHNAFYFAALAGASAATAVTKAGEAYQSAVAALGSASVATQMASTASVKANSASVSALKAEGFAVGEQNGVPVESGDYFENNAAYYASVAASAAASAASSAESVDVHKDGTYEDMTVGNAFEVLSDRGDTDKVPYVFRKTGGAKKAYNREMLKKIVGGTVAWNQLCSDSDMKNGSNKDSRSTLQLRLQNQNNSDVGLKSLFGNEVTTVGIKTQFLKSGFTGLFKIKHNGATNDINFFYSTNRMIVDHYYLVSANLVGIDPTTANGVEIKNFMLIDLTMMFGSAIAEALYEMQVATPGSGSTWFRSLFPNDYYVYDAGTLMSVQTKEHRLMGLNWWDEQWEPGMYSGTTGEKTDDNTKWRCKNLIRIYPNTNYYFYGNSINNIGFRRYDGNKNFIGIGVDLVTELTNGFIFYAWEASYISFFVNNSATKQNNICINISDSSKNGTYEPYDGHVYPLDSDLVLRGIPKWDNTNGLYYDGDEYAADGTVKRRYGIVDLGTLDWTYNSESLFFKATVSLKKYGITNLVCVKYATSTAIYVSEMEDKSIKGYPYSGDTDSTSIYVKDSAYTDADTFKTAMSGVYLVYELATPTTETADPYHEIQICNRYGTEEFVDAGVTASTPTRDVSIPVGTDTLYNVNVFDYIEELTNPDHDMIADSLIPSGKYFMVGNSLYYSTSQIQAGATINPGTNCTAISLAEALNTINQ